MRQHVLMRRLIILLLLFWSLGPCLAIGQEYPLAGSQSPLPESSDGEAVPLSELCSQAVETQARLNRIEAVLKGSATLWNTKSGLPLIIQRISAREKEDTRLFSGRNEADVLKEIALQWQALDGPLNVSDSLSRAGFTLATLCLAAPCP